MNCTTPCYCSDPSVGRRDDPTVPGLRLCLNLLRREMFSFSTKVRISTSYMKHEETIPLLCFRDEVFPFSLAVEEAVCLIAPTISFSCLLWKVLRASNFSGVFIVTSLFCVVLVELLHLVRELGCFILLSNYANSIEEADSCDIFFDGMVGWGRQSDRITTSPISPRYIIFSCGVKVTKYLASS